MRLNFEQIATAYGAATVASVSTGAIGGYLWAHLGGNTDYVIAMGGAWLVTVGVPSMIISAESLRRVLGQKSGLKIVGASAGAGAGNRRKVPINYANRQAHVFLSSLPLLGQAPAEASAAESPSLPDRFEISVDGTQYTILLGQVEDFLYTAWKRQRGGRSGLSRAYWTRDRRPERLTRQYYEAIINLLVSVEGLVVDRGEGRSGKLVVPPQAAVKALQGVFNLA